MAIDIEINQLRGLTLSIETRGHTIITDGKKEVGGKDRGATPKELLLGAIASCSAMDVVSLLKKHQITYEDFSITANADMTTSGHPVIFDKVNLIFKLRAVKTIDESVLIKSVELSMTKYCGVSAMVSKAVPIFYKVMLNDIELTNGKAQF